MEASEIIAGVLVADEVVAGLLTGGIYTFEQIGRNGISRVTTAEAYDASGFLKPCMVVKAGEARAARALRDDRDGIRQRVEVYLYDDGDNGYGTINAARDAVVVALDRQWVDGAGYVRWAGSADDLRDAKLNNAAVVRVDFEIMR